MNKRFFGNELKKRLSSRYRQGHEAAMRDVVGLYSRADAELVLAMVRRYGVSCARITVATRAGHA